MGCRQLVAAMDWLEDIVLLLFCGSGAICCFLEVVKPFESFAFRLSFFKFVRINSGCSRIHLFSVPGLLRYVWVFGFSLVTFGCFVRSPGSSFSRHHMEGTAGWLLAWCLIAKRVTLEECNDPEECPPTGPTSSYCLGEFRIWPFQASNFQTLQQTRH